MFLLDELHVAEHPAKPGFARFVQRGIDDYDTQGAILGCSRTRHFCKVQLGHGIKIGQGETCYDSQVCLIEGLHSACPDLSKARNPMKCLIGTKPSDTNSATDPTIRNPLEVPVINPCLQPVPWTPPQSALILNVCRAIIVWQQFIIAIIDGSVHILFLEQEITVVE